VIKDEQLLGGRDSGGKSRRNRSPESAPELPIHECLPRKDIWLTSKPWNSFHAPQDVEPALDESLSRLGTDYPDLYLIHWSALKLIIFIAALSTQNFRPVAFVNGGKQNELDWELTEDPYPTWKKLEEMVEKGKVRNIGISKYVPLFNYPCHFIELKYKSCTFNILRIQNLTANPLKIKPHVNQVELNYWNPKPELLKVRKLFEPFLMHIPINMKIVVQRKRYFTGSLFPTWQCRKC